MTSRTLGFARYMRNLETRVKLGLFGGLALSYANEYRGTGHVVGTVDFDGERHDVSSHQLSDFSLYAALGMCALAPEFLVGHAILNKCAGRPPADYVGLYRDVLQEQYKKTYVPRQQ